MTRNQNLDNDASSNRPQSCVPWSALNHHVLNIVMMKLGAVEFLSFSGVRESWRSLALLKKDMFMASMPPMSITISTDADEKVCCYLEDFEGRKFKTILPNWFSGGGEYKCIGVTCGYLIFLTKAGPDFWLLNLITSKQLHFPNAPFGYYLCSDPYRAILFFSPSTSELVFVVVCDGKIWYSIEGKGAWKQVSNGFWIDDMCAFKGKIYTIHENGRLCELGLYPEAEFTLHETRDPLSSEFFTPLAFDSSGENLYVIVRNQVFEDIMRELDVGEWEWVTPCEKKIGEYSFFYSDLHDVVFAVRQESWPDPNVSSFFLDKNKIRKCFSAMMWYFPHESMDGDCIDV